MRNSCLKRVYVTFFVPIFREQLWQLLSYICLLCFPSFIGGWRKCESFKLRLKLYIWWSIQFHVYAYLPEDVET